MRKFGFHIKSRRELRYLLHTITEQFYRCVPDGNLNNFKNLQSLCFVKLPPFIYRCFHGIKKLDRKT